MTLLTATVPDSPAELSEAENFLSQRVTLLWELSDDSHDVREIIGTLMNEIVLFDRLRAGVHVSQARQRIKLVAGSRSEELMCNVSLGSIFRDASSSARRLIRSSRDHFPFKADFSLCCRLAVVNF